MTEVLIYKNIANTDDFILHFKDDYNTVEWVNEMIYFSGFFSTNMAM